MPTYTVNDKFQQAAPNIDPATNPIAGQVYTAQPKSFFLSQMYAYLGARGSKLYNPNNRGSVPHRFLDSVAFMISQLSLQIQSIIDRAVLRSAYLAFGFTLTPASYATALVRFNRNIPAPAAETILAGTLIGAQDGRTAVTLEDVTLNVGDTFADVVCRAEVVGSVGNAGVGVFNIILSPPLNNNFTVSNITPMTGGQEEENPLSARSRFLKFIADRNPCTPSGMEVLLRGISVVISLATVKPRDVVIIRPWLVPQLALPPSTYYVVVESGGGTAPSQLVTALQTAVNNNQAIGDIGVVGASTPYVVNLTANYKLANGAVQSAVEADLQAAWLTAFNNTRIEDGSLRGLVTLAELKDYLASRTDGIAIKDGVPDFTFTTTTNPQPPIGGIVVGGTLTLTLVP